MRWKLNPDVVVQRLGDSMVLVNLTSDRILELNETAAALIEMAGEGRSGTEIVQGLAREYSVDPEVVAGEVERVLASLAEESVVIVDAG